MSGSVTQASKGSANLLGFMHLVRYQKKDIMPYLGHKTPPPIQLIDKHLRYMAQCKVLCTGWTREDSTYWMKSEIWHAIEEPCKAMDSRIYLGLNAKVFLSDIASVIDQKSFWNIHSVQSTNRSNLVQWREQVLDHPWSCQFSQQIFHPAASISNSKSALRSFVAPVLGWWNSKQSYHFGQPKLHGN